MHILQAFTYSAELWDPVPCSNKCSEDQCGSTDITGRCGHRGRGPPGHSGATGENELESVFSQITPFSGDLEQHKLILWFYQLKVLIKAGKGVYCELDFETSLGIEIPLSLVYCKDIL